jgi:hypothetical protein
MAFGNFFAEIDSTNHRQMMIAGLVILVLISFILLTQFFRIDNSPEAVEKAIKSSERLNRVNQMCENLPKPEDFKFIEKSFSGNSFTSALSFLYSTKTSSTEVREVYVQWFETNGWSRDSDGDLRFAKDNKEISITRQTTELYSIYCAEVSSRAK